MDVSAKVSWMTAQRRGGVGSTAVVANPRAPRKSFSFPGRVLSVAGHRARARSLGRSTEPAGRIRMVARQSSGHAAEFLRFTAEVADRIDRAAVERLATELAELRAREGRLFLRG